jgi:hypothetical protein
MSRKSYIATFLEFISEDNSNRLPIAFGRQVLSDISEQALTFGVCKAPTRVLTGLLGYAEKMLAEKGAIGEIASKRSLVTFPPQPIIAEQQPGTLRHLQTFCSRDSSNGVFTPRRKVMGRLRNMLTLMGTVLLSRNVKLLYRLQVCVTLSGFLCLGGCGGSSFGGGGRSSSTGSDPHKITVTSPTSSPNATVISGTRRQFEASVIHTSSRSVTWSSTAGNVSSLGLFTAPIVSTATRVTITATSQSDPKISGSTTITVTPSALTATGPSMQHTVSLSWKRSTTPNFASFNMYRSTVMGSSYELLASAIGDTVYSDQTVRSGTTYYYVVAAVNDQGQESGYSNEVRTVIP